MELRQLRYLLALAEEGHVGKAAARVHITQPGLSQQIRKLEDELGVSLVERHSHGVRLSAAAEALLPFARNILRQVHDARMAVKDLDRIPQGTVTVGSLRAISMGLLPRAIARLVSAYPGVRVEAHEMAAQDIELGLQEGRLDLGVGFLPVGGDGESFHVEPLFQEELVLAVRAQHPLAKRDRLPLAELPDVPLVLLPKRFHIRQMVDQAGVEAGLGLNVTVEMDTVHSLLGVVHDADLGTLLPTMAFPDDSHDLRRIPLTEPIPVGAVGLIWRNNSFRSLASRALAAELRTLAQGYASETADRHPREEVLG